MQPSQSQSSKDLIFFEKSPINFHFSWWNKESCEHFNVVNMKLHFHISFDKHLLQAFKDFQKLRNPCFANTYVLWKTPFPCTIVISNQTSMICFSFSFDRSICIEPNLVNFWWCPFNLRNLALCTHGSLMHTYVHLIIPDS